MIDLRGQYGSATVFTDDVDQESIAQIIGLLNQKFTQGSKIRMMPDVHAGAGCTIGTTMTITDKVVPNLVGVDIGCGMETIRLSTGVENSNVPQLEKLDRVIRAYVPSGFLIRDRALSAAENIDLDELYCRNHVDIGRAYLSIGTLGGGNHFVELGNDEKYTYLTVHSGSRHLGLEVANYYQRAGYERLNKRSGCDVEALVREYKAAGKQKQINDAIKALKNTKRTNIPRDLAYVEGDLMQQYLHDMVIVQKFAAINRHAIVTEILAGMGWKSSFEFSTIHNYIDTERMILRKGAVSAQVGEPLLIPMNMRDGSLLCVGLGNPDWNFSAPHGAGRIMSRAKAKRDLRVDDFKEVMRGIFSTSVGYDTIDESPMVYKPMDEIIENIEPTAEIVSIIKPIYNFKASSEE